MFTQNALLAVRFACMAGLGAVLLAAAVPAAHAGGAGAFAAATEAARAPDPRGAGLNVESQNGPRSLAAGLGRRLSGGWTIKLSRFGNSNKAVDSRSWSPGPARRGLVLSLNRKF